MKKYLLRFLAVGFFAITVLLNTQKLHAATLLGDYLSEKGVEVDVSAAVDYYDKYMWRGFTLDKDNVIQPSVTIAVAGFEGGFWGSWDVENDDALNSDEVDGWIGYGFDLGFINEDLEIVSISIGNTWYYFPQGDTGLADGAHAEEMYLGFAIDTFLSPYFTWYHDYGDESSGSADGDYFMFGAGHSFTLSEEYGITLDLGQEIGLNNEAFIAGDGGYSLTTVGFTIPLSDNVTLAPMVGYSAPFGDLEDSNDGNQKDEVYGGFSLSFSM